ncbi:hypothetical protein [Salinicola acroporae]|uniref:Uncharacterized protein n=1 Tax=Salinicola acroporae TaxID=1541440 RepID=A0ABT6I566_9GAMM|nr:hypothetical protein [Salinicola acroporae]MDH4572682.1 hypothetical protein [Salinicola acroporae]
MATTDEKLDAILLMQAEILGRLEATDVYRAVVTDEDPRVAALRALGGTSMDRPSARVRSEIDAIVEKAAQWGRPVN